MAGLGEVRIINLIAHQRPIVGPGGIPPRISGFLRSIDSGTARTALSAYGTVQVL